MNAEELIERLKKSFNAPSKKDEKFKVVLLCIVISTTFWFFNALNQEDYSTQINYPVEWSYDNQNYLAVGALPQNVPIEVTGGGWDLMTRSFGFNMPPVEISLSAPNDSKYMLTSQLRGDLSRNLEPVLINFLILDSLKFDIQEKVDRSIALVLDNSGVTIDSDYQRSSDFQLSPDTIVVTGPQRIVEQMPASIPVIADVRNVDGDYEGTVNIPALPSLVTSATNEVTLSFEVMRYISISENYEVELVNAPDTLWKTLNGQVLVDYSIGEVQFDATDSTRIKVIADFNQIDLSDSTIMLEVIEGRSLIENINLSVTKVKVSKDE